MMIYREKPVVGPSNFFAAVPPLPTGKSEPPFANLLESSSYISSIIPTRPPPPPLSLAPPPSEPMVLLVLQSTQNTQKVGSFTIIYGHKLVEHDGSMRPTTTTNVGASFILKCVCGCVHVNTTKHRLVSQTLKEQLNSSLSYT